MCAGEGWVNTGGPDNGACVCQQRTLVGASSISAAAVIVVETLHTGCTVQGEHRGVTVWMQDSEQLNGGVNGGMVSSSK